MIVLNSIDIEVANRLPLADSTLRLLHFVTEDGFLAEVFQRHRGRCFERDLKFPLFVHLMADAILGHRGSAHKSFRAAQEEKVLPTSVQAMYDRLATLPCEVSLGFFAEAAHRLDTVSLWPVCNALPRCVSGFKVRALDGKKLKYVVKRLKPLRGLKGNVLGGKLLAVQDVATGRAVVVEADLDGEAADNPLIAGALARVRALPASCPNLWLADRGFCDYNALPRFAQGDDHFVVRHHAKCKFHADPSIAARTGLDDEKRPYREEWGWLGGPDNKKRVRVRMISVSRPSGGPFTVVTSLLDADRYPAAELLTLYRCRWGIETMFQQVVQTFDLRHLIGATAQATIFQAVFCLLLYNINLTICDFVAEGAKQSRETMSLHLLHEDTVEELTAWMKVIGPEKTPDVLDATIFTGPEDFRDYLRRVLKNVWKPRLIKAKTTKRPKRKPPRAYLKGGHSSVERIVGGTHKEIPIKPKKPT
jgi:hypothetical protein